MAKQRKTRKEKIRSSERLQQVKKQETESDMTSPSSSFSYKIPTTSPHSSSKTQPTALTYNYIGRDLIHTLFITGTIILAQIILFVLLQAR